MNRIRQFAHDRPWLTSLILIAAVAVPGAYRQEKIVDDQHHADCVHGNESRAAIRGGFSELIDTFVSNSSPASQPRIRAQGNTFLAGLAKKLPERPC